jgi:hypothetical protein
MHYRKHSNSSEEFIRRALPENWVDYALELKNASNYIWKGNSNLATIFQDDGDFHLKPHYSRSCILLFAFAIENLLKGVLISEKPKLISGGKLSKTISVDHNLPKLSKEISTIKFSKKEAALFEMLAGAIPDWGKYPVPKRHNNLKDEEIYDDKTRNDLNKLFEKLEDQIWKLNREGKQQVDGVTFPKMIRFDNEDDFLYFIEKNSD